MLEIVDQFMNDVRDMIKTLLVTVIIIFMLVIAILVAFLVGYLSIKFNVLRSRSKNLQFGSQQLYIPNHQHFLLPIGCEPAPE